MTKKGHKNIAVVGAGFFGISIAVHMAKKYPNANVMIIESQPEILSRASQKNQARVHRGYHYPRSFRTAFSSNANYSKFRREYYDAVISCESLYGIAKNSLVDAKQFNTIYSRIGAPIKKIRHEFAGIFDFDFLQEVFEVKESLFNFLELKAIQLEQIEKLGIDLRLNGKVIDVTPEKSSITVTFSQHGEEVQVDVDQVFNCTYTMLNQFDESSKNSFRFVHELTEVALYEPPMQIKNLAITIMDGPFFSTLPFPSQNLHSLTHVTFTPHSVIEEKDLGLLYERIDNRTIQSRFDWMLASAKKFIPVMEQARYIKSNFEIKSTLQKSIISDSRPIFVSKKGEANIYNVFGAKLDNVYDVLEFIDKNIEVV